MNRHRRLGFTLIELMIVVVILSIIAAIGIPNMMRSRLSAQEASAIATMRTISSAQAAAQAQVLFPDPTTKIGLYGSFVEFDGLIAPKPLDSAITTPPPREVRVSIFIDLCRSNERQSKLSGLCRSYDGQRNLPTIFHGSFRRCAVHHRWLATFCHLTVPVSRSLSGDNQ